MKTLVTQFGFFVAVSFLGAASLPAATVVVTNTLDDGLPGCLRWAITNVNLIAGSNSIHFNIPGAGPHTIQPLSALPLITANVLIDGYTQPGSSVNTLPVGNNAVLKIELNGANTPGANTDGLQIFGPVSIRGLVINRFNRHGIHHIDIGAAVHDGRIRGCFIGTDASGTVDLGNGGMGVFIEAAFSTIGGTNVADRNVISGNGSDGIYLEDDSHVIQNNYVGTDKSGTNIMGNGGLGITAGRGSVFGSTNNPVAGRNVVAANASGGISVNDYRNTVVGNYIGTDASGVSRPGFGNNGAGVAVGGNTNMIGGLLPGHGNLIAGNNRDGVRVDGDVETGFFTNGWAVAILGNSIYGNGTSSGEIGIDLQVILESPAGVTPNDACDSDYQGGNRYQNFPSLTSAASTSSDITIAGSLNSTPNTTYLLEFFANGTLDSSGFGEGETFIGRTNFAGGENCTNEFSYTFPIVVAAGKLITATASLLIVTNAVYETSEFSPAVTNVGPASVTPPYLVNSLILGNGAFQFTFTNASGVPFTVLAQTNPAEPLSNWTVLGPATESPPGQFQFNDPQAAANARRFYRARSP
jgi:hypothetical protein